MKDGSLRFIDTDEWGAFVKDIENESWQDILPELEFSDAEDLFGVLADSKLAQERVAAMIALVTVFFEPGHPIDSEWRTRLVSTLENLRRHEPDDGVRAMAAGSMLRARVQEREAQLKRGNPS